MVWPFSSSVFLCMGSKACLGGIPCLRAQFKPRQGEQSFCGSASIAAKMALSYSSSSLVWSIGCLYCGDLVLLACPQASISASLRVRKLA